MNLPPYVFDVDHVAKIRSELSITVLEKKTEQNYRLKKWPKTSNYNIPPTLLRSQIKEEKSIEDVVNNGPHNLDGKRIDPKKATKNSKIFVGGLKQETSDEDVRKYFETEFGEIDTLDR